MQELRNVALAILIGTAGAVMASWLGFPAPALTGPALCVTIASVAGLQLKLPVALRDACFTGIGMTVGAAVTPEMVATALQWPASIFILFVALIAIMALGTLMLERGFGYDRTTAMFAAAPGHLSFVLGMSAASQRADLAAISIIQSTRVLALTLVVPFLALAITGGTLAQPPSADQQMTLITLVVTAVAAIAVAQLFLRLRVPAAYLLGGMLASSVAHLTGIGPGSVPSWISIPAFVIMGTLIGTRFSGVAMAEIRRAAAAALAFTALAAFIAALAGVVAMVMLGLPLVQLLVAYAPGGLEAMAAMALLLGINPAFVAAHHVARLLILTVLIPLMVQRTNQPTPNEHDNEHDPA